MIFKFIKKIKAYYTHFYYKRMIQKLLICPHQWYGTKYGGFYVNPTSLSNESVVYSFGVGEDVSFDLELIAKHNCHIFAFDPTPKSIAWIENQTLSSNFTFMAYGIDVKSGYADFNLPKNRDYVSGSLYMHENVDNQNTISVPMKSFSDIISELGHKKIDVLKMDIEGAEYDVMNSILDSKSEIKQILLEVHERFFEDGRAKTMKMFKLLKSNGYKCFAISASKEEFSFLKE